MIFDQMPPAGGRVRGWGEVSEFGKFDLSQCGRLMFLIVLRRGYTDGNISRLEGGDLVLVGILGIRFVSRPTGEMQVQSICPLADQQTLARQADSRRRRIRQIGEEYSLPQSSARHRLDILHIENAFWEPLVKHSRLHFERCLRRLQFVLELSQRGERAWGQINAVAKRKQPGYGDEKRNHAQEGPDAQAARAHGSDFAVGGKAAQADENADQHAHRNRVGQRNRNSEEEDLGNARQRGAVANHQFEDVPQIAREKDKGKNTRADQRVGDDFSQNIAGEDAHPHDWLTQSRV